MNSEPDAVLTIDELAAAGLTGRVRRAQNRQRHSVAAAAAHLRWLGITPELLESWISDHLKEIAQGEGDQAGWRVPSRGQGRKFGVR